MRGEAVEAHRRVVQHFASLTTVRIPVEVGLDLGVVADHAARWHQVAPQRFHAVCLSWEFGMRDPRVPSVWSLIWTLMDPVSCVSCVSW
jgi:hypothetical protein